MVQALIARPVADPCSRSLGAPLRLNRARKHSSQPTSSEKFRIRWSVILVIFAARLIALIALSVAVANYSSFMTASSAAAKVGPSIVDDQSGGPMGSEK